MSRKKTVSVKVPLDLLEAMRTFHSIRSSVNEGMVSINMEADALSKSIKDRHARLEVKYSAALATIKDTLIAAKIIREDDDFAIDTMYLEDHGEAFIRIDRVDDTPSEPPRIVH